MRLVTALAALTLGLLPTSANAWVKVYTGILTSGAVSFSVGSSDPHRGGWGSYSIEAFFSAPTETFEVNAHRYDTHLDGGGYNDQTNYEFRDSVITTHSDPHDPLSILSLFLSPPHRVEGILAGLNFQSGSLVLRALYNPEVGPVSYRVLTSYVGVPEPAEWAMMISGMALVGLTARGRRLSAKMPKPYNSPQLFASPPLP